MCWSPNHFFCIINLSEQQQLNMAALLFKFGTLGGLNMKNRLLLIVPALLMLTAFSEVPTANATTEEPTFEIVVPAENDILPNEPASESTLPENPPPETTLPEILETETITPETIPPEATAAEADVILSEDTVSEVTVPEEIHAEITSPESTESDSANPKTTELEAVEPGSVIPDATAPESDFAEDSALEAAPSEETEPTGEVVPELPTEEPEPFAAVFPAEMSISTMVTATTGPSELINRVDTTQKVVSLTISDITSQTNLTVILANLASTGVKATFFVDGTANPNFIQQIAAAGHEIGNQSYQHIDTTQLTAAQLASEVNLMDGIIQDNAGTSSIPYFRAPYGTTNTTVLNTVGSLGYTYTIGWTKDTRDWTGTLTSSQVSSAVTSNLSPGAIYLLHANALASTTPAALLSIISTAKANGYQFETIGGLLSLDAVIPEIPADEPSELITKVDTGQKVVSLTISDVTSEANLDAILTNLGTLGVKATFFVDGTANPDFIQQIVAAGHEVGNQSYQHIDTTQLTPTALASEINQMESVIQDAAGTTSKPYFRAPFGITNASVLNTAGSLGYAYTIGWTTDTRDWTGTLSASQISSAVVNSLTPGAIYLLHANALAANTPAALLNMISSARTNGYDFATISELIALTGAIEEPETPVSTVSQLIDQVDTNQKVIALTFDDGDSDEYLADILYNLNYLGVKGTFFLNGWANADLMNQIVVDGHQLANHGYSHDDSTAITSEKLISELNMMEDYIVDTTGTSSLPFFRAPHGLYNDSVLETVGSLGYQYTIGWSIDTIDWTGNSESEISDTIIENVHPGAIVLLHANTGAVNTAESLWYTVAALREAGYTFATVAELMALDGYEWEEPVVTTPSQLVTQVNTDNQVISLTISDASDAENLRQILASLEELDVKATFFLNGMTDPNLIDDIIAQGHEIGNHTYSHTDATDLTSAQLTTELNKMEAMIQTASGTSSKPYFRAPMGATNSTVLETAGSLGYQYTIGWTTDTRDWTGTLSATQITSNVVNNLAPGAIYLLHGNNLSTTTPAALLQIISQVRTLGYEFKTISGLLAYEDVYTGGLPDAGEEEWSGTSRLVDYVETDSKVIALTFDDGDDYDNLYDILWNLNTLDVKATFFLNGTTDSTLMRQVVTAGHQLANHTYSHYDYSTELSAAELSYDINLMEDYILETTGVSSKPYFRAPSGDYNDAVLDTVGSLGYRYTIGWTQDTRDWTGISEIEISDSVTEYLAAGSIYLLHANPTSIGTPESLWYLVSEARNQGYEFVTIEELLALEN